MRQKTREGGAETKIRKRSTREEIRKKRDKRLERE
jgi:hypothetical protein